MCQLLGMNGNTPTDIVFSFTGFSTRAEEHKDGFGIAFFEGAGVRLFVDAQSARDAQATAAHDLVRASAQRQWLSAPRRRSLPSEPAPSRA